MSHFRGSGVRAIREKGGRKRRERKNNADRRGWPRGGKLSPYFMTKSLTEEEGWLWEGLKGRTPQERGVLKEKRDQIIAKITQEEPRKKKKKNNVEEREKKKRYGDILDPLGGLQNNFKAQGTGRGFFT